MKTILRIAKTELRVLFYSPIAWFLLIVFFIQCGVTYFARLDDFTRQQEMGGMSLYFMPRLTPEVFTSFSGVFNNVMANLYLYVPLLTMSLISRETSSGTIKLLYSSPVKVRAIVLGKYLAMLVYSLLMVAIVGVYVLAGMAHIQSADTGILLSALLGFYLLMCAYAAIGLFMSSLTTYQVVAAICTFVMIGILSYIGTVWQKYEFVRTITYFLSLSGRAESMLRGLITTQDVIYFLIIVFIFVACTIYRLRAGMESKPALVKASRYVAVVLIAMVIGYISSRHTLVGWYDATRNKSMTIAPREREVVQELKDGPLKVTTYINILDGFTYLGVPQSRTGDFLRWEPYIRFKNDIDLKYVMYYDTTFTEGMLSGYPGKTLKEIAQIYCKNYDVDFKDLLPPDVIRKQIDLKGERYRYVMHLQYKDRSTFLRVFDDQFVWPTGTEVTAAFKRLLQAKLPKIVFVTGDLERDVNKSGDRDYQTITSRTTFRYSFVNQGFDVDTVSLNNREIPTDAAILVLADPKVELTPLAKQRLQQYIAKGGNLLIAGEPGKQQLMNPLLAQFGVQMMDGIVAQTSKDLSPDLALPLITKAGSELSKAIAKQWNDTTGINYGVVTRKISMPGVTGLTYSDTSAFHIQPLLQTDSAVSWLKKDKLVTDSAAVVFNPANGDEKISLPVALSLTRQVSGKEQRIIITGDADFMNNAELMRYNVQTANFTFNTGLFSWLCYNNFPIDSTRPPDEDKRVKISGDAVGPLKILYLWIVPGIMIVLAAILLIRRKRK